MMKIPVGKKHERYALVDDEDYRELMKFQWRLSANKNLAYAVTDIRFKGSVVARLYMHNLVMFTKKGDEVDHKDHDGLNNQKSNLRFATRQQQMQNTRRTKARSGFRGVKRENTKSERWSAYLVINGRTKYLGCFDTPVQAAVVYNEAAMEHYGEFACLNEIPVETVQ